jgi:hypothetical protein
MQKKTNKISKDYVKYFLPPFFLKVLFDIWAFIGSIKYRKELKRNLVLENKFEGGECIILGNAPSLNNYDLSKIKNKNLFFLNSFHFNKNFKNLLKENKFKGYLAAPIHPPQDEKEWKKYLEGILKNISDNTLLFLGLDGRKINLKRLYIKINKNLRKKNVFFYFAGKYYNPLIDRTPSFNISKSLIRTYTASLYALQVAISLGFKRIYLLGIDHSDIFIGNPKKNHFYGKIDIQKKEWERITNLESVKNLYEMFSLYSNLNRFSDVRIVNLSETSLLNFLPYKPFSELFN